MDEPIKSFDRLHRIDQGFELHIQRTHAHVVVESGPDAERTVSLFNATVLLNEFSAAEALFFCEAPLSTDRALTLRFPEIKGFSAKAKVIACNEVILSAGIIHLHAPQKYRVKVRFEFTNERERLAIEEFVAHIQRYYLRASAA